ncbi:MAG: hypothetical protein JNM18_04040 [Planctomycetaceae bacterium]|nr:hypothetical protein [Planctomycetaceae bacterium]
MTIAHTAPSFRTSSELRTSSPLRARSPQLRDHYLTTALADIPRLIGSLDRNPFRATHGSFDRQFWHYRTAAFPSEMYQEAVLPLALIYTHELPGNRWHRAPRLREWIVAGLQFSARAAHADGSCDDYYPYERALGAAVFSLNAAAEACRLLAINDRAIVESLRKRAAWIIEHGESGTLANHHALAALALERVARLTGDEQFRVASRRKLGQVLGWQSDEGWFNEYGGADPGYQTVTIDCLAKLRALTGDTLLDEPLQRAVTFARRFLHPDGSYGGEYGSRGTYHFYPHGCELLAHRSAAAADLADGFLASLAAGRQAYFADDRMYVHRLGNLLEAYLDWSPDRPEIAAGDEGVEPTYLPHAQLLVDRTAQRHTVVSAARGGVVKHFVGDRLLTTDTGLVLETTDGRAAVSQLHDLTRDVQRLSADPATGTRAAITVTGPLNFVKFETATPLKQAVLHLGMITVGRWCRDLVRRVLQRRVITGRRRTPVTLSRTVELLDGTPSLRITDRITLDEPHIMVRRMSISSDLEAAYVAASGVYQDSVLQSWTSLDEHVATLNRDRHVTVVRQW